MQRNVTSIVIRLFTFTFLIAFSTKGIAQQLACPVNIDWELGDTTGWTAQFGGGPSDNQGGITTGVLAGNPSPPPPAVPQTTIVTQNAGFAPGRFTVTNTSMPADPFGGFPVVSPLGGQYAIKIGDDSTLNGGDRVQFLFNVPSTIDNYSINFLYAVVIQNPTGHPPENMPRFTVSVKDAATGQSIKNGCYDLNFVAGSNLPGFQSIDFNGEQIQFKDWTRHTLNLSGTAGKTVIVEVTAGDCSQGGHFGYGYFDVENCAEFKVVLDSCNLNMGGAYMHAPEGYATYEWYTQDFSQLVDTGQYVAFQPLTLTPQQYNVILTPYSSVSSCPDTIKTPFLANMNIGKIDSTCLLPQTPVILNANIYGGSGALTYAWTETTPLNSMSCNDCAVPTVKPPLSNNYIVTVTDTNKCFKSEIMTIGVNENKIDAIEDFVLCRPGYTQLDAEATGPAPLTPVVCGLVTTTGPGAASSLAMRTLYRQPLSGIADTSSLINPFAAQYASGHMQFLVNKKDLYTSGLRYGTLSNLGFEVTDPGTAAFGNFTISLLCTDLPAIAGSFIAGATPVYSAATPYIPHSGWNDFPFTQPYSWDTSKNLLVDICFSNPTTSTPATVVALHTGNQDAIAGYSTALGSDVCATGAPSSNIKFYTGRPSMRATFTKSPDAPFQYTWMPSTFLQDSTMKSPLAYVNQTIEYFVETVGGDDCKVKDSVTITVPIHDYDVLPKDTSVCEGTRFEIVAYGTPASVQWYEYDDVNNTYTIPTSLTCSGCTDPNKVQRPVATGMKSLKYAIEYTDKYGCKDTLYMNTVVRPLPNVHILNDDTTIKYGQSLQLLVSGAYLYSWSPLASLTNPNLSNPYVAPTEPTTFYVWGLADDGCRNLDSVRVNIDYRDNLFVPSAFTPNGDGKNDVFRISNITFQKLQEFRVFNRWGQEIYSTTDAKKGWDGSWKGVPQDMGIYQYLIKVAYPDGYIETYKGDVSLVR